MENISRRCVYPTRLQTFCRRVEVEPEPVNKV